MRPRYGITERCSNRIPTMRWMDVMSDVAFLVMDLERRAGTEIAGQFLRWYEEFSNEHHPQSLADHYVAYRALVRAKVNCLRAEQGSEVGLMRIVDGRRYRDDDEIGFGERRRIAADRKSLCRAQILG